MWWFHYIHCEAITTVNLISITSHSYLYFCFLSSPHPFPSGKYLFVLCIYSSRVLSRLTFQSAQHRTYKDEHLHILVTESQVSGSLSCPWFWSWPPNHHWRQNTFCLNSWCTWMLLSVIPGENRQSVSATTSLILFLSTVPLEENHSVFWTNSKAIGRFWIQ